jgi:hypothetical protein
VKDYTVYHHPTLGFSAVKIGFSWPALFFGIIWMLIKRLWILAALWFAAYLLCGLIEAASNLVGLTSEADEPITMVDYLLIAAYLALSLVPGFKGNKWRERDLAKHGFCTSRNCANRNGRRCHRTVRKCTTKCVEAKPSRGLVSSSSSRSAGACLTSYHRAEFSRLCPFWTQAANMAICIALYCGDST